AARRLGLHRRRLAEQPQLPAAVDPDLWPPDPLAWGHAAAPPSQANATQPHRAPRLAPPPRPSKFHDSLPCGEGLGVGGIPIFEVWDFPRGSAQSVIG